MTLRIFYFTLDICLENVYPFELIQIHCDVTRWRMTAPGNYWLQLQSIQEHTLVSSVYERNSPSGNQLMKYSLKTFVCKLEFMVYRPLVASALPVTA
jgi:hypothetical protein